MMLGTHQHMASSAAPTIKLFQSGSDQNNPRAANSTYIPQISCCSSLLHCTHHSKITSTTLVPKPISKDIQKEKGEEDGKAPLKVHHQLLAQDTFTSKQAANSTDCRIQKHRSKGCSVSWLKLGIHLLVQQLAKPLPGPNTCPDTVATMEQATFTQNRIVSLCCTCFC